MVLQVWELLHGRRPEVLAQEPPEGVQWATIQRPEGLPLQAGQGTTPKALLDLATLEPGGGLCWTGGKAQAEAEEQAALGP